MGGKGAGRKAVLKSVCREQFTDTPMIVFKPDNQLKPESAILRAVT
jgi:hypothetical protein